MLDSVLTYLVHECLDDLIPTITAIINESLVSGIVLPIPPFKQAVVLPLLKQPNLEMCLRTIALFTTYISFQRFSKRLSFNSCLTI